MTPDAFTYGTKSSMLRGCSITNHPAIGVPYSKLFDRVNKKQHTFHYMTALSSPCAESGLFDNPSIKTQPQKPVRNLGFVLDENFCFLDEGIHSNCSVGPSRFGSLPIDRWCHCSRQGPLLSYFDSGGCANLKNSYQMIPTNRSELKNYTDSPSEAIQTSSWKGLLLTKEDALDVTAAPVSVCGADWRRGSFSFLDNTHTHQQ